MLKNDEKIEASLLMSISEFDFRRDCIINSLKGISIQEVPFPFELCLIDDASNLKPSDIKRFIESYFKKNQVPNLKRIAIKSLKHKAGFTSAPSQCMKLVSPESNKMIVLASDCIFLQKDAIKNLCDRVGSKKPVFSEVAEIDIKPDFYKDFDVNAESCLRAWPHHLARQPFMVSRIIPNSWLFFAGAALKEDLLNIGYDEVSCDAVLWQKMMPANYNAEILTYVRVAHQSHPRIAYPCPRVTECEFFCSRTRELKGTQHPAERRSARVVIDPEEYQ